MPEMQNPEELGAEAIDAVWKGSGGARAAMSLRQRYYDGNHRILERSETYTDGTQKRNTVTNWIKYIVNRYVGALSEVQLLADADGEPEGEDGVLAYQEVVDRERLVTKDRELLRDALLKGMGVEVVSYREGEGIKINVYEPETWAIVDDEEGAPILAVHQEDFEVGDVYGSSIVKEKFTVRTIYDSVNKRTMIKESEGNWRETETVRHLMGSVPVVIWATDAKRCGIVSDALMVQNDEYNMIDSMNGDSIVREVDNLLVLRAVDPNWLQDNIETIRSSKTLPLPADEDADAKYLVREFDNERVRQRLDRTRGHIHMMGEVPDVAEIVGSTGSTSGIALKLMFTPMHEHAETIMAFWKRSIRRRIELFNYIWNNLGKPTLVDYQVNMNFRIPVNRIEEWSNIAKLKGEVSHKTRLSLLTDIEDPAQELEQVREEEQEAFASARDRDLEPDVPPDQREQFVERREAEARAVGDAMVAAMEPSMRELTENITSAIQAALNNAARGGA